MKKKVLAGLAIMSMLMANGISVFASNDINVSTDTTGNTQLNFTVTPDMLGGDLIVSIPAEMTLFYNSSTGKFVKSDYVSAKGGIAPDHHLEVSAPTSVTYTHKDKSSIKVNGSIGFGNNGKEVWSAEQLIDGLVTPQKRDVTASASISDIKYVGNYGTNLVYNIQIVKD